MTHPRLEGLIVLAEQAALARALMLAEARDYYGIPTLGAFIGEHTRAVVMEPAVALALLRIAEVAWRNSRHPDDGGDPHLWEALEHLMTQVLRHDDG